MLRIKIVTLSLISALAILAIIIINPNIHSFNGQNLIVEKLLNIKKNAPSSESMDKVIEGMVSIFKNTTPCPNEDAEMQGIDHDINLIENPDLTVMFHGNRYVAAEELIERFKNKYDLKVAWTAIPPINTVHQLSEISQKEQDTLELKKKIYPDVVMLPSEIVINQKLEEKLEDRGVYSDVRGIVLVTLNNHSLSNYKRSDFFDDKKVIFPGQSPFHPLLMGVREFLGDPKFIEIVNRKETVFSKTKHHRSVPARILAGCGDVGFQYQHSRRYLELKFPGRFQFENIPVKDPLFKSKERSNIYFVKKSTHKKNADLWIQFILSDEGQELLSQYGIDREK